MSNKLKKSIFRLKLGGTFDTVVRHAFMSGYTRGHKIRKSNLVPSDLEKAYKDYKTALNNRIRNDSN